jgi:hypothetical protein
LTHNSKTIQCIVIAQSAQVHHVLVVDEVRQAYAVTEKRFNGDWLALRRGDVVEVTVTEESLPQTLSARLIARRGSEEMNATPFEWLVGTVPGRAAGTPYVLVECRDSIQYAVNRRVFAGDWDALAEGDSVALAVSGDECVRVLSAWLVVPPSTPRGDC